MDAAIRVPHASCGSPGRAHLTKPAFVVGNFARRLRDGQRRSREADDYAREIGMPLKDWQVVVQTHVRGGTEEEREALLEALERDEMPIDRLARPVGIGRDPDRVAAEDRLARR